MITLIVGTNRPNSNSRKVAREFEDIYASIKVPLKVMDLATLPPQAFAPSAYWDKPPEFLPFSQAILDAEGLVIVAPEYNGGIPGILKYFIDLLKFPESFDKRPVCFTGLSAGVWGGLRTVEHLQQVFGYRNAFIYPERVFIPQINGALNEQGRLKDPELMARMKKQAEGFVDFVERLKGVKLKAN